MTRAQHRARWQDNLTQEIAYWRLWLETRGDEWPEDYAHRTNPRSEFDPQLRRFISLPQDHPVWVLDVGAGPITGLGFVWPGRKLSLVALDPLADRYNRLLEEFQVCPPVRTQACPAERLRQRFRLRRFELVHCRNALDHAYDPVQAIGQMLAVTKPGGTVILDHYANEAVHHSYSGLHQWNFDIQEGRFVIWDQARRVDVASHLEGLATVSCQERQQGRRWVMAQLSSTR